MLVPDVSNDPRYIKVVDDARSELVIPLMLQDRCIGVFDLESPELDAFSKSHVEILTLLASQAAVAIENARLYQTIRANEVRLEKEIRFAQRVQAALLPTELPKRLKGVDVAARFAPARELGGDLYDFLAPEPNSLVVAVGDVSGKGVPAALYSAFAGELVRSRTFRRRYAPERFSPAGVLASINTILHERQLEEYYCTLCYAVFDFKRRTMMLANSGLPYPIRVQRRQRVAQIVLPGVPLGSFPGSTYDELTFDLARDDVYVFCSDGVFEANDALGREFGAERLLEVVNDVRTSSGARDRGRDLRGGAGVPRRHAAERRHDGGRDQGDHMKLFDALLPIPLWSHYALRARRSAAAPSRPCGAQGEIRAAHPGDRVARRRRGRLPDRRPDVRRAHRASRARDVSDRVDDQAGDCLRAVQAGRGRELRLDETMTLDRAKAVGGSGILIELGTPTLSIRDYAALMVTLSDNTATNVLIDRLGMERDHEANAGPRPQRDEAAPPHDGHRGRAPRRRERLDAGRDRPPAAADAGRRHRAAEEAEGEPAAQRAAAGRRRPRTSRASSKASASTPASSTRRTGRIVFCVMTTFLKRRSGRRARDRGDVAGCLRVLLALADSPLGRRIRIRN